MATIKNPITVVSGGGPAPSTASEYGRMWIYPWTEGWVVSGPDGCTAEVTDIDIFLQQVEDVGGGLREGDTEFNFEYQGEEYGWFCYNTNNPIENVTTQDLNDYWGLSVVLDDPDPGMAMFNIIYTIAPDTTSPTFVLELNSDQWSKISNNPYSDTFQFQPKIPRSALYKFEMGTQPTSIPNNFLYSCYNLEELDLSNSNATTIGTSFCSGCGNLDSEIDLSGVTSIDGYFLNNCVSFAHDITLPSSVASIGMSFMAYCSNFTGILTINTSAPAPSDYASMYSLIVSSSIAPAYVDGVRLAGPYASAWKTALPDLVPSGGYTRYRKLIDTTAS